MNEKIAEFYSKVTSDENLKAKFENVLDGKEITSATDEQLEKIGEIAKDLGYNFTIDEVKKFIASGDVQLSDDALDNVAGGADKTNIAGKISSSSSGSGGDININIDIKYKQS